MYPTARTWLFSTSGLDFIGDFIRAGHVSPGTSTIVPFMEPDAAGVICFVFLHRDAPLASPAESSSS